MDVLLGEGGEFDVADLVRRDRVHRRVYQDPALLCILDFTGQHSLRGNQSLIATTALLGGESI